MPGRSRRHDPRNLDDVGSAGAGMAWAVALLAVFAFFLVLVIVLFLLALWGIPTILGGDD